MANPVAEFFGLDSVPPFDVNTVGMVWSVACLYVIVETIRQSLSESAKLRKQRAALREEGEKETSVDTKAD